MGVSFYSILTGLGGIYFANKYIYRTFFNSIPKTKKLAVRLIYTFKCIHIIFLCQATLVYLSPKRNVWLDGLMSKTVPFARKALARDFDAFQCIWTPEYELIAPIILPKDKLIHEKKDSYRTMLFHAQYNSEKRRLSIIDFERLKRHYEMIDSDKFFEVMHILISFLR